ncbi:LacI family DNA-binding transcriptional regulator [Rariglobus hedericola]|uniref:LacI family transcriptional regulator n=1 Tax=Rariglobus hedericola TaxID=2597822 RepID=A0A556QL15_9BACT|nr:LacI family DNA-binding transcriptional regulator [Rariglobus hedericola]TSJ77336.1 LacI family transcriptional regulator [Rariglobus hedericola]
MASEKSVRIKDIADRLGLSMMSVSVALRGMPGVSEKTRKAVKACAAKLGYRPDPALSALADYRRRVRPTMSFAQLAFVTDYPVKDDPFWGYTNEFLYGAQKRGQEYGYNVVPFWLREGGMTRKQASSVLFNRGIKGLLIAPLPVEDGHLDDLTWKYFAAVAIGPSMASPQLDHAVFDHHHATQTVLRQLHERGYRRIGFLILRRRSTRVHHMPLDAYLGHQYRHEEDRRIEPYLPEALTAEGFWRWFDDQKPDVIVTDAPQDIPRLLAQRGLKSPLDVGLVCVSGQANELEGVSAIIQDLKAIGAAAMDRLHTNLLRHAYGPPQHAHGSHIRGHWQEGMTLKK